MKEEKIEIKTNIYGALEDYKESYKRFKHHQQFLEADADVLAAIITKPLTVK